MIHWDQSKAPAARVKLESSFCQQELVGATKNTLCGLLEVASTETVDLESTAHTVCMEAVVEVTTSLVRKSTLLKVEL
jgi:hypothetical protein